MLRAEDEACRLLALLEHMLAVDAVAGGIAGRVAGETVDFIFFFVAQTAGRLQRNKTLHLTHEPISKNAQTLKKTPDRFSGLKF